MPHEEDLRRYEAWKSKLRATIEAARRVQAEARAEWLAEALGVAVPEFGYETRAQGEHPLMPPQLRREIVLSAVPDVTPYVGLTAIIEGELHTVAGADPQRPGMAIIVTGGRTFSTTIDTIRRYFNQA